MPFLLINYTIMSNAWRTVLAPQYILNGKATTGVWTTIPTKWFKHILVEISSEASSSFTVKLQWAMWTWNLWQDAPDFSSAKKTSNPWDYIEAIDYNDWSPIDWNTWIPFSSAVDVNILEYNINGLDYINAEVTAITAWAVTVRVRLFTND